MNGSNSLIIDGIVVDNADLKDVAGGKKVASFSIAHNRYTKNTAGNTETTVSYFNCECWGKVAEYAAKNALKGITVRIIGRLNQNNWIDSEGKKHSHVRIVCEHIEYIQTPTNKKSDEQNTMIDSPTLSNESTKSFQIGF